MKRVLFLCTLILSATTVSYFTQVNEGWLMRYSYLEDMYVSSESLPQFNPTDEYFLVVLVDARHADYSSPRAYLTTLTTSFIRQRSPDPGHAWIILGGKKDGKPWIFEGGHSVDCNLLTKNYVKDMLGLTSNEDDDNPARHLFNVTKNGLFEYGPGENIPTFAAAIPLTEDGFERILKLFEEDGYDFSKWGIEGPNCVQFALSCLSTVGIEFECEDLLPVPPKLSFFGKEFHMWSDPSYSALTLKTPDLLEKRLWELVKKGTATCATQWYWNFKEVCEKGYLATAEIPTYPKPESPDRSPTATVDVRCEKPPTPLQEDVILLEDVRQEVEAKAPSPSV